MLAMFFAKTDVGLLQKIERIINLQTVLTLKVLVQKEGCL